MKFTDVQYILCTYIEWRSLTMYIECELLTSQALSLVQVINKMIYRQFSRLITAFSEPLK